MVLNKFSDNVAMHVEGKHFDKRPPNINKLMLKNILMKFIHTQKNIEEKNCMDFTLRPQ